MKIRKGFDDAHVNAVEIARIIEANRPALRGGTVGDALRRAQGKKGGRG